MSRKSVLNFNHYFSNKLRQTANVWTNQEIVRIHVNVVWICICCYKNSFKKRVVLGLWMKQDDRYFVMNTLGMMILKYSRLYSVYCDLHYKRMLAKGVYIVTVTTWTVLVTCSVFAQNGLVQLSLPCLPRVYWSNGNRPGSVSEINH